MTSSKRTWRCYAPGYRIRNRVAIYGGGHTSVGRLVWEMFAQFMHHYPESCVWLEFGNFLSYEDKLGSSSGKVVGIENAFCTGLH